jgi:hypothetical protein
MWWQRSLWLVAALWWGSLTALGAWVVPLLFAQAPTKAVAAGLAVHLFSAQAWVGLVCGVLSLVAQRNMDRLRGRAHVPSALILAAMMLAAIVEWGLAPRIVARENMLLWHSLGTAFWVLQWGCLTAQVWRLSRPMLDAPWPQPDAAEGPEA